MIAARASGAERTLPEVDGGPDEEVELGTYYRVLGGVSLGRGVRFNNPYRLQTQLGQTPESLSLTAPYAAFWAAFALGAPDALLHGISLHVSVATEGIAQEVMTPSYLALYQPSPRWLLGARAGLPIVIEPDANVGGEVAASALYLLTAGLGLSVELVGSLFFGAATLETSRTTIPIVSLQVGAAIDYEVLP